MTHVAASDEFPHQSTAHANDGQVSALGESPPHIAEPTQKPSRWRYVVDHNPFFLISGMLMLAGCYTISGDLRKDPDALQPIVLLLGIVLVYQTLVLGLGLWLGCRDEATWKRDAMHLLMLWLLLTVDSTMLYHEVFTRDITAGLWCAGVGSVVAVLSLLAILRILRPGLDVIASTFIAIDLVAVFVAIGLMRWVALDGFLPSLIEMKTGWVMGVWIAIHAWPVSRLKGGTQWPGLQWALLCIPLISLVSHVFVSMHTFSQYGTDPFDIFSEQIAPLILAIAAIVMGLSHAYTSPSMRASLRRAALVLGVVGLLACVFFHPYERGWLEWRWAGMHVSRPVLALTGFAALLLAGWLIHRSMTMLTTGYLLALVCLWLHAPRELRRLIAHVREFAEGWLPDTRLAWGVIAVVLAFITLITGAMLSNRRAQQSPPP